jgi:plasmid stability protein
MRDLRSMARNLQVRDIPDPLHRELKRRARNRGESLTDYVQGILEREVARPPAEEVFRRIESRRPVDLGKSAAELIREERAER